MTMKHIRAFLFLSHHVFFCFAFQQPTSLDNLTNQNPRKDTLCLVTSLHSYSIPTKSQAMLYATDTTWNIQVKDDNVFAYKAQRLPRQTNMPFKRSQSLDSSAYLPGKLIIQHVPDGMLV